jgi:integrase
MGVKVRERPKGSGIWWIFIDHQGKRKSKKVGRDKKVALEAAKKIEAKLALGDMGFLEEEKAPTFAEYATMWITVTVPATCKSSTLIDYKSILDNHVLPAFGKLSVTEINRLMVKNFLQEKSKDGLAQSTVSHMKSVISGTLNLAVDDDAIVNNPALMLGKIQKTKSLRETCDFLTREELTRLLSVFDEHYPRHYPLALTLARTGIRFGEALALQWGDIDFSGRFIKIQRTFSRGKVDTPKSGKSRDVDMSMQLKQVLEALRRRRKIETTEKGCPRLPEWVFVGETGNHVDGDNWRKRIFDKSLEKAGLRKIRIHDLRHTFASLLIQAGESLAYVRDQMGHHSIKVTVDIYGHLAPGGNKDAVDRLDDVDATTRNLSATIKEKGANQSG